ncbi:hypothetical protein ACGF3G_15945 [Streptomyces sp. NPDC048179]|uniref:hypothetical protein n=1 Tax=Streptomyces sp. NPDC048179 TaxID=3365506 RepID=UPI00370FCCF5
MVGRRWVVDFWGLRLQLVCPLHGLPVACALTGAEADDRATVLAMFDVEPELVADRPGRPLIGDKNYFGAAFEARPAELNIRLLRPARKGAFRHNDHTGRPVMRSLAAYDH